MGHTPTPLITLHEHWIKDEPCEVWLHQGGERIARLDAYDETKLNAIVTACNAHESLVALNRDLIEALEKARDMLITALEADDPAASTQMEWPQEEFDRIDAVLVKAREGK